nr:hypothetical protein Q903MT_gene5181 [Picea sitchensis]
MRAPELKPSIPFLFPEPSSLPGAPFASFPFLDSSDYRDPGIKLLRTVYLALMSTCIKDGKAFRCHVVVSQTLTTPSVGYSEDRRGIWS